MNKTENNGEIIYTITKQGEFGREFYFGLSSIEFMVTWVRLRDVNGGIMRVGPRVVKLMVINTLGRTWSPLIVCNQPSTSTPANLTH